RMADPRYPGLRRLRPGAARPHAPRRQLPLRVALPASAVPPAARLAVVRPAARLWPLARARAERGQGPGVGWSPALRRFGARTASRRDSPPPTSCGTGALPGRGPPAEWGKLFAGLTRLYDVGSPPATPWMRGCGGCTPGGVVGLVSPAPVARLFPRAAAD